MKMRMTILARVGLCVLAFCTALLLAAPLAYAGVPLQGIPVGLDHDPEGIAVAPMQTDARGNAVFSNLKAGRYAVTLPASKSAVRVSAGGASATFKAGMPGRLRVTLKSGGRLVVMVSEAGGRASASKEKTSGASTGLPLGVGIGGVFQRGGSNEPRTRDRQPERR